MKHIIDGKEVNIDWEIFDIVDTHDSGYNNVALEGEDENGVKYIASGDTLSGDICDVYDIEVI